MEMGLGAIKKLEKETFLYSWLKGGQGDKIRAILWLTYDGRNDIAGDGKRKKIWREGRYGNDQDAVFIDFGQCCPTSNGPNTAI